VTVPERLHLARIRELPCCRCGQPGASEAHHVGTYAGGGRCDWATIPLCPTTRDRPGCHRGKSGAGHAPGLRREELGLLQYTLGVVALRWGMEYADFVRERLRECWARRLSLRSGQKYREVLE